jgi:hypothetical protein
LSGEYIYGDFCTGRIWSASFSGGAWTAAVALDTSLQISSFGEDAVGELYVSDYSDGVLYRLTAPPSVGGVGEMLGAPHDSPKKETSLERIVGHWIVILLLAIAAAARAVRVASAMDIKSADIDGVVRRPKNP